MIDSQPHHLNPVAEKFLTRAGIELNRAERYRIFISLTELDLGFPRELVGEEKSARLMDEIGELTRRHIRGCDYAAFVGPTCLCLLFPETSRQGAEVAARRLSEIIQEEVSRHTEKPVDRIIPVELASYPDAAGAKTINQFLEELQHRNRN